METLKLALNDAETKSSRRRCSIKNFLKNFAKFTRKLLFKNTYFVKYLRTAASARQTGSEWLAILVHFSTFRQDVTFEFAKLCLDSELIFISI